MKERPILFSGEMVNAIISGRKTVTRRVVKLNCAGRVALHGRNWHCEDPESRLACPYGQPGDRLWVRETWAMPPSYDPELHGDLKSEPGIGPVCFREVYPTYPPWPGTRWRSPRFMPRWASRITLEVTGVRVERLQEVAETGAMAEGVCPRCPGCGYSFYDALTHNDHHLCEGPMPEAAVSAFSKLWDSINAKRGHSWESNPYVWVVEFKRIKP